MNCVKLDLLCLHSGNVVMLSGFFQGGAPSGRDLFSSLDKKAFYCVFVSVAGFDCNGKNCTENVIDVGLYLFKDGFICPPVLIQFLIALAAQRGLFVKPAVQL